MLMTRLIILSLLVLMAAPLSKAQTDRIRSIVASTGKQYAPDKRQSVFEISVSDDKDGWITVSGKTSDAVAFEALGREIGKSGLKVRNKVSLLPSDRWAMPVISVANIRTRPSHSAELASQVLMGMPLRELERDGNWLRVQCPDGYIGWIACSSVTKRSDADMRRWRSAERAVVTSVYQILCYRAADASSTRDVVSDLVNGDIVELTGLTKGSRSQIILPDGRKAWVDVGDITPAGEWAARTFDAGKILDMAYSMEGQPYLWGGTSTKSLDCSGLVKVCYLANGIILRRDASQQAVTGRRIEAGDWRSCRAGDLLFFGNAKSGKVTHVAIYDNNGAYIHSSGRVMRNSVDPASDRYLPTPFLHCVRIDGCEGSDGITRAKDHPWYFNL